MPQLPSAGPASTSPLRSTRSMKHRGLQILVTASRRVTGVTVVSTRVSGGPDDLRRDFYTLSPQPDPEQACAAALHHIREVLDRAASAAPRA